MPNRRLCHRCPMDHTDFRCLGPCANQRYPHASICTQPLRRTRVDFLCGSRPQRAPSPGPCTCHAANAASAALHRSAVDLIRTEPSGCSISLVAPRRHLEFAVIRSITDIGDKKKKPKPVRCSAIRGTNFTNFHPPTRATP